MKTNRLLISQLGKHNVKVIPGFRILVAPGVREHAQYPASRDDRAKFIESFWNIAPWEEVNKRFVSHRKKEKR